MHNYSDYLLTSKQITRYSDLVQKLIAKFCTTDFVPIQSFNLKLL